LTGILKVDTGKAAGRLFFVAGDPVASEDVTGIDDDVRARVLAVFEQSDGHYAFTADASFVEHRTIRRVNPFGVMLESVRRRYAPANLLEALAQVEWRYALPGVGLDRAAPRLRPFVCGKDIAALATGSTRVHDLLAAVGIDPLVGALVLMTLEE